MTLKAVVDSLDTVPEAVRDLYTEQDGKFHLAVEGLVHASKVAEFRNNNISLVKQIEELTKKYEGIDPEQVRVLNEQARQIKDQELIAAGKVEELFAQRLAPVKTALEGDLNKERTRANGLQSQLESLLIDGAIRDASLKAGVRSTAQEDVLLRARQTFRLQDGKAVPMDGDKVLFGKNGDPMSVGEWISGLSERAPHLFEPSQGGGATGGKGNVNGGGARISAGDNAAFLANLKDIAANKVRVTN